MFLQVRTSKILGKIWNFNFCLKSREDLGNFLFYQEFDCSTQVIDKNYTDNRGFDGVNKLIFENYLDEWNQKLKRKRRGKRSRFIAAKITSVLQNVSVCPSVLKV